MKIRLGFVSNSSSTSYVVALTRDFKTTQDKMQEFLDSRNKYTNEENWITLEQADKEVGKIVDALCTQGIIWEEYDSPPEYVRDFVKVFREDIRVVDIDGGPEDGKYINLFADDCKAENMKMFKKLMETHDED